MNKDKILEHLEVNLLNHPELGAVAELSEDEDFIRFKLISTPKGIVLFDENGNDVEKVECWVEFAKNTDWGTDANVDEELASIPVEMLMGDYYAIIVEDDYPEGISGYRTTDITWWT